MPGPIRLGDPTTGGGVVIHCRSGNAHTLGGIPLAVKGDKATCAVHQGMFPFVEGDDGSTSTAVGPGAVLEGHKLACGCHAISTFAPPARATVVAALAPIPSPPTAPQRRNGPLETAIATHVSLLKE